jgi:predicted MPP superfamily phosphohydrolase
MAPGPPESPPPEPLAVLAPTPAPGRPVGRIPRPVEAFDLPLPTLPHGLEGLTILHVADLHIRAHVSRRRAFREILDALAATPVDLVVLTGDYMDQPGHEEHALAALELLVEAARPGVPGGFIAVFGNHDTLDFRHAARRVHAVRWLDNTHADVDLPGRPPIRVLGLSWPEDPLAATLALPPGPGAQSPVPFCLTLAHMPNVIFPGADLGLPLVLAGHTHAGQVRFGPRSAPHTSSDTPAHLASGVLRLRDTLLCISRGLGEAVFEGARFNCPRQMPRYTLRRAPLPATPDPARVTQVIAW